LGWETAQDESMAFEPPSEEDLAAALEALESSSALGGKTLRLSAATRWTG
jgi:hypothetical protein